jgi:hypothetical protein
VEEQREKTSNDLSTNGRAPSFMLLGMARLGVQLAAEYLDSSRVFSVTWKSRRSLAKSALKAGVGEFNGSFITSKNRWGISFKNAQACEFWEQLFIPDII